MFAGDSILEIVLREYIQTKEKITTSEKLMKKRSGWKNMSAGLVAIGALTSKITTDRFLIVPISSFSFYI